MAINNILKYGATGDSVKSLQAQLNDWGATQKGFVPLATDGIFGNKTQNALRAFQQANNITVDGIYGNQTAGAFAKTNVLPNVATMQTAAPVTPTPVVPTPIPTTTQPTSPYDMKFNYNAAGDTGLQAASQLANSRIAQEMAARGIGGSTIEQERIAQALAGLTLDFRNQAYQQFQGDRAAAIQKYETDYQMARQAKEDAWNTAQERGYFNNEEARLWGMKPGEKTSSQRALEAQIAQQNADRQAEIRIAQIKAQEKANEDANKQNYDVPKSFIESYQSRYNNDAYNTVGQLYKNWKEGLLTDGQAYTILNSLKQEDEYTVDAYGNKIKKKTTATDPWALWRSIESSNKSNAGGKYSED